MAQGALSLLGGIGKGILASRRQKEDNELRQFKIDLLKAQTAGVKAKSEALKGKSDFFTRLFGDKTLSEVAPKIDSFTPGLNAAFPLFKGTSPSEQIPGDVVPQLDLGKASALTGGVGPTIENAQVAGAQAPQAGVTDLMSQLLADPLKAQLVKSQFGLDIPAIQKFQQTASQFKTREGRLGSQFREGQKTRERQAVAAERIVELREEATTIRKFEKGGKTFGEIVNKQTNQPLGIAPFQITEKKGLSSESAAKLQLAKGGVEDIDAFEKLIIPNGVVDDTTRLRLAQMQSNMPLTKGRTAGALIDNAIEAKIRAESGAAVPEEEVVRIRKRFRPNILDSDELIISKIKRMRRFLTGTINIIDPSRRYSNEPIFITGTKGEQLVWEPSEGEAIPEITTQEEYDALPSGAEFMEDGVRMVKP